MLRILEFVYLLTMFICVSAFSVHMTVKFKKLPATSKLAKQNTTTAYLLVILLFNLCDFLILYMSKTMPSYDPEWLYLSENLLEVALIYVLIAMEKEYSGAEMPRLIEAALGASCMVIIYFDGIFDWNGTENESLYFALMILINIVPILILIACSFSFWRKRQDGENSRRIYGYLGFFNLFCVLLCVVCTLSNADQQTRHQFIAHSGEIEEFIWLVFNVMNFDFIWKTINTEFPRTSSAEISIEDRMSLLRSEFGLSDREVDIARLLYEGKNNKEIAQELYLSPNTVKVHASNLYHKLGAANRVQAVQIIGGRQTFDQDEWSLN